MSKIDEKLAERVTTLTERLETVKAEQLRRELRRAHLQKKRHRGMEARKRAELGKAVLAAGCGDLSLVEVIGALVDARERFDASPTVRLALKKRGQERMADAWARAPPTAEPPTASPE